MLKDGNTTLLMITSMADLYNALNFNAWMQDWIMFLPQTQVGFSEKE